MVHVFSFSAVAALTLVLVAHCWVAQATDWEIVSDFDADCDRDKATKSTETTQDDCEKSAQTNGVDVFSWNKESHHCYTVNCSKFTGSANPRTISGCVNGLDGCSSSPPSPSPPPPPTPPGPSPDVKFDGVVRPQADGSLAAYMIPPYKSNHAATIEVLPDGTLAGAWFSGEYEEAPGCAIVFARLMANATGWTTAATVSKQANVSNQNPVLFFDNTTSILHLFHSQAKANSGESTAEIWHLSSPDFGTTWTPPQKYFTTLGDFPRNRIIRRTDGTLLFPYYSQGEGHPNRAVMGVSMSKSVGPISNWKAINVENSDNLVQPSSVRLPKEPSQIITFFRDRRAKSIYSAITKDEGLTWTTPKPTVLPNNNAGIEANSLISGNLVITYNPQTSGRDPLAISISEDGGVTWPHTRLLQHGNSAETKSGNEFSYPTVLQTSDGSIHVMFTYDRDTIKYMVVTEEWIKAGAQ
eukprot:m.3656 g.3656  ORF g.3656 m.3656 type:complete len:468 (-) comp2577_c0_seq1:87-1490(-)